MQNRTPLSRTEGQSIIDAFKRFNELNSSTILVKGAEAEKKALQEYILTKLFLHASELLGCWQVMRNEYEPLVQGVSALFGRAHNLLGAALQQQAQAPEAPTPDNVVKL
jgi:hypothetical protein